VATMSAASESADPSTPTTIVPVFMTTPSVA
jgi:hypothetical protein